MSFRSLTNFICSSVDFSSLMSTVSSLSSSVCIPLNISSNVAASSLFWSVSSLTAVSLPSSLSFLIALFNRLSRYSSSSFFSAIISSDKMVYFNNNLSISSTSCPISGLDNCESAPSASPFFLISSLISDEKITTGTSLRY